MLIILFAMTKCVRQNHHNDVVQPFDWLQARLSKRSPRSPFVHWEVNFVYLLWPTPTCSEFYLWCVQEVKSTISSVAPLNGRSFTWTVNGALGSMNVCALSGLTDVCPDTGSASGATGRPSLLIEIECLGACQSLAVWEWNKNRSIC